MRLMLYTLFALVVADGLITQFLVANGHALEANPFLLAWAGQELFIAIKVSGAFVAISSLVLGTVYLFAPSFSCTFIGSFILLILVSLLTLGCVTFGIVAFLTRKR
ncbi:DUF5658 family protein [Chloroflexota bacterium]